MGDPTKLAPSKPRSVSAYLTLIWPPLLALLALFGLPAPTSATLPPAPAGTRGSDAHPLETSLEDWARPSAYCGERFLEPLLDLAVATTEPRDPKLTLVGTEASSEGATSVRYKPEAAAYTRDVWRSQLVSAKKQLQTTLNGEVSVLIATVPDPDDSALPYHFDSVLEALRRGVGSLGAATLPDSIPARAAPSEKSEWLGWSKALLRRLGLLHDEMQAIAALSTPDPREPELGVALPNSQPVYFPGRRWLPWDDRGNSPGSDGGAQKENSHGCRATTPGILLFRDQPVDDSPPHILALLLVGETPTSGAHASALSNALDVAALLERPGEPIRIIGPTFSGGAAAMRVALDKWVLDWNEMHQLGNGPAPPLSIVSGSATAPQVAPLLRRLPHTPRAGVVDFRRTTPPDKQVWCAYVHYLGAAGVPQVHDGNSVHLRGVVLLHEAGTVFGDTGPAKDDGCTPPEIDASFPFHVASIRSAYGHGGARPAAELSPAPLVRTSLDVSLEEQHHPTDLDSNISELTPEAAEAALARLLAHLSQEGVRHVAIRATDVSDSIFLARKIREVTPDVRLAFLTADALLTHDQFAHDLFGSLVVTPYPFLGTNDFSFDDARTRASEHHHQAFSNSMGEGIFNAVLAAYDAPSHHLLEYTFPVDGRAAVLPIWLASIGRSGIAPIRVEAQKLDDTVYQTDDENTAGGALHVSPEVVPPRIGHIVFALLCAATVLDHWQRKRAARRLSPMRFARASTIHDRDADLAIGKTKWRLCAAVRAGLLALAIFYMTFVHLLAICMWPDTDIPARSVQSGLWVLGALCAAFSAFSCSGAIRDFRQDFREFLRYCEAGERGGFRATIRDSRHQVTLAAYGALLLAFVCAACLLAELPDALRSPNVRVLLMLRLLPLNDGLSPATPILLALLAMYIWMLGVMARLEVAHATSGAAPPDHTFDLVATPICTILHGSSPYGEAHAALEARLLNAIWRPFSAPVSGVVIFALALVPLVSFVLKKPSSLEGFWGTLGLFLALIAVVVLIGVTLIQFIRYWVTLRGLTEHIASSPFAAGFDHLEAFARASIDRQVSRSADDFYQFIACAHRFNELAKEGNPFVPDDALDASVSQALLARAGAQSIRILAFLQPCTPASALGCAGTSRRPQACKGSKFPGWATLSALMNRMSGWISRPGGNTKERERKLAKSQQCEVNMIREILEQARKTKRCLEQPPPPEGLARISKVPHSRRERSRVQAQGLVASVIALLVGRHVCQFRCFAFALTAQAIALLLAVVSYAFEPQRLMLTWIWVMMFVIVGVGFWIFFAMDRDPLLSRIAGTPAGEITLSSTLVLRLVGWGALPLLSVAAAQYPHLANALSVALSPFARALR